MNIPYCYDPAYLAERLALEQDKMHESIPCCTLCQRNLYPGMKYHTAYDQVFCPKCVEELNENIEFVE